MVNMLHKTIVQILFVRIIWSDNGTFFYHSINIYFNVLFTVRYDNEGIWFQGYTVDTFCISAQNIIMKRNF